MRRRPRPGLTTKMPKDWPALCAAVRDRDGYVCRRCGALALDEQHSGAMPKERGQVDHLLPRRLLRASETRQLGNLALLCAKCHAFKTHVVEPALYAGHMQAFIEFLKPLGPPLPSMVLRMRATARLIVLIRAARS
jgi:5-methylcytosine-specific restriction endonuclease McrA